MGKLKNKRSTAHSFVEYVETEGRRGPKVHERVVPSSPLKRRASASPSKTRHSTPNASDYPTGNYGDSPTGPTPKRKRVDQKVSMLHRN
jgi:hypothetical protein